MESIQEILVYFRFFLELMVLGFYTLFIYASKGFCLLFPGPPKSLRNEVILITGGANGIGREICLQLVKLEQFLTIISWDKDKVSNDKLIQELRSLGVKKASGYTLDVGNQKEVEDAARRVRQEVGEVTMLFNNAGIPGEIAVGWNTDPAMVRRVFDVNILAHCWTLREFLPSMIARKSGHVIETCSVMAFGAGPNGSAYIASKCAIQGYIESVKEDLRSLPEPHNIVVSLVYPHHTVTDLTKEARLQSMKYPFMFPQLKPDYVASKILYGTLHNQEHIYAPGYLRLFHSVLPILPPETIRRCTDIVDIRPADDKKGK